MVGIKLSSIRGSEVFININSIDYIEALSESCLIHLRNTKSVEVKGLYNDIINRINRIAIDDTPVITVKILGHR